MMEMAFFRSHSLNIIYAEDDAILKQEMLEKIKTSYVHKSPNFCVAMQQPSTEISFCLHYDSTLH